MPTDAAPPLLPSAAPALTYAATVRAICSAIRKIARANPLDLGGKLRWRGVRGTLPPEFWRPDATGCVYATDLGLMSTSAVRQMAVDYMQVGAAGARFCVLWEMRTSPEDERGFHSGADVSLLSQFAHEKEELFPPLTMLHVLGSEAAKPEDTSTKEYVYEDFAVTKVVIGDIEYLKIIVEPIFV